MDQGQQLLTIQDLDHHLHPGWNESAGKRTCEAVKIDFFCVIHDKQDDCLVMV